MSFQNDVRRWANATEQDVRDVIAEVFTNLGNKIVNATPIGDKTTWSRPAHPDYEPGTLRNSWHAGIGTDFSTVRGVRSPNTVGSDALSNIRGTAPLVPGNIAYLANPAPYANRVENGWSQQAPAGMLGVSLLAFDDIVKRAARAVN